MTAVRRKGRRGAGLFEEGLGDPGESAEAVGGDGLRLVHCVDEQLAQHLGDVALPQSARVAADAAAGSHAPLAAAGRLRLDLLGIVDEAEGPVGKRAGAAGVPSGL